MATATLRMTNPLARVGLKRRPTYNEIINAFDWWKVKNIFALPNRDSTFFNTSPECSLMSVIVKNTDELTFDEIKANGIVSTPLLQKEEGKWPYLLWRETKNFEGKSIIEKNTDWTLQQNHERNTTVKILFWFGLLMNDCNSFLTANLISIIFTDFCSSA